MIVLDGLRLRVPRLFSGVKFTWHHVSPSRLYSCSVNRNTSFLCVSENKYIKKRRQMELKPLHQKFGSARTQLVLVQQQLNNKFMQVESLTNQEEVELRAKIEALGLEVKEFIKNLCRILMSWR